MDGGREGGPAHYSVPFLPCLIPRVPTSECSWHQHALRWLTSSSNLLAIHIGLPTYIDHTPGLPRPFLTPLILPRLNLLSEVSVGSTDLPQDAGATV